MLDFPNVRFGASRLIMRTSPLGAAAGSRRRKRQQWGRQRSYAGLERGPLVKMPCLHAYLKEGGYANVNNFKQFIYYSGGANGSFTRVLRPQDRDLKGAPAPELLLLTSPMSLRPAFDGILLATQQSMLERADMKVHE
jgi:hypothetical protein